MKFDYYQRAHGGAPLPPLRTITEMAEEFGLKVRALSAYLAMDVDAPKKRYRHRRTVCNSWYDPREMRTWWRKHPANPLNKKENEKCTALTEPTNKK